jgi:subtilase family serine protease
VLSSVRVAPGESPGTALYTVSVANTGGGAATKFNVAVIVDGALADSRTVDVLKPGATTTVNLTGPACRRLRALVDRGDFLSETVEEDNELRSRC